MAHKTKVDRQREAMHRKRKCLPAFENSVLDAVQYAKTCDSAYAFRQVDDSLRKLEGAYIDSGYSVVEAADMARAAADGNVGSWLGGALIGAETAQLAAELARDDLQVYVAVRMARQDLECGNVSSAIARLRVDADKLRCHGTVIAQLLSISPR